MNRVKILLLAITLFFFWENVPSLCARHHSKIPVQRIGYSFKTIYRIHTHSKHSPLEARLEMYRFHHVSHARKTQGRLSEGRLHGELSFAIDKKMAKIKFSGSANGRLTVKKRSSRPSSLWCAPVSRILAHVERYDMAKGKYTYYPRHTRTPFRIVVSGICELNATYTISKKRHTPFQVTVHQEKGSDNKTIVTAIARQLPCKDVGDHTHLLSVKYRVSKKGLEEVPINHNNTHYRSWCAIVKKAVQKTVDHYFKLQHENKKLCRTYIKSKEATPSQGGHPRIYKQG